MHFVPGKTVWNNQAINWILAFTAQDFVDNETGDPLWGLSSSDFGIVLMKPRWYPGDDNCLYHEQTHLLGTCDHRLGDPAYALDCVCSYRLVRVFPGIWDSGWFWPCDYMLVGFVDNDCHLCSDCHDAVQANLPKHGFIIRWMVPFGGDTFAN